MSDLKAFKIDDADGIAENIGFKANIISKVDYFLEDNLDVQFIEMSDLRENLKDCNTRITKNFAKIVQEDIKDKSKREKEREVKKKLGKALKMNFVKNGMAQLP